MVVIMLTAVLALVVVNFFSFEGALDKRPARDQLQRAVAEGHRQARTERSLVMLRFDSERQSLLLESENGQELGRYDLPRGSEAMMSFYRLKPDKEISQEPKYEAEEDPVRLVSFEPNGASLPFLVLFEQGNLSQALRFDPFSALCWEITDVF